MEASVRHFGKINLNKSFGSQVGDDPKTFIDVDKKLFGVMQVIRNNRSELASYQPKDVGHIWCVHSKKNRGANAYPVTLECFKRYFLDMFLPRELRDAKV